MAKPSLAEIAIVAGARTPMSEWIGGKRGDGQQGGALATVSAIELGAVAARAAIERAGITPDRIDHVIMGNALQTSADALRRVLRAGRARARVLRYSPRPRGKRRILSAAARAAGKRADGVQQPTLRRSGIPG